MGFIDTIENKLKLNKGSNITQQDAENAQKFLFEQMDNVMLALYKENPELMQEIMEKSNQFYASNQLTGDASYHLSDYYQSLEIDEEKISALLLEYGARTESERVEEVFVNYLGDMANSLRDYIAGEEIDYAVFLDIKVNINQYRYNKMHATGYSFFASVTDKLSPALQEQITDAIAQVMSFYSQPHSMEINGYKISWEFSGSYNPYPYLQSHAILYDESCFNISIEFSTPNSTLTQNTFLSLASNFDSSQTFFEVLEQRDKLEKENQELKNKESFLANPQNTFTKSNSTDSIMQTLLKESKEGRGV